MHNKNIPPPLPSLENNYSSYRRLLSAPNATCAHTRSNHAPSASEKTPVPPSVDPRRTTTLLVFPVAPSPPGRTVETRQRMPWRQTEGRSCMMVLFWTLSSSFPTTSPSVMMVEEPSFFAAAILLAIATRLVSSDSPPVVPILSCIESRVQRVEPNGPCGAVCYIVFLECSVSWMLTTTRTPPSLAKGLYSYSFFFVNAELTSRSLLFGHAPFLRAQFS